MSRKPRICFEKAFYHVTSRGDNKEKIFRNDWNRKVMFNLLKKAKEDFRFKLRTFVLMRNHFHFVIETSESGTISEIMHYINGNYTKYFNNVHERCGHLFQGRFHGVLIDRDAYLLEVSRYIHLNPVRAGLVVHPKDYKWSSYLSYVGVVKDDLVDKDLILDMISSDVATQIDSYVHFVNDGLNLDFAKFKEKLYSGQLGPADIQNSKTSQNRS